MGELASARPAAATNTAIQQSAMATRRQLTGWQTHSRVTSIASHAGRIGSELAHAGYDLASLCDCPPGSSEAQRRITLEDHISFRIAMTARPWREQLGSRERAAAASARAGMADSICETLYLMRVALRRRRASRGQGTAPLHRPARRSEPGCREQAHCGEMSVEV